MLIISRYHLCFILDESNNSFDPLIVTKKER